MRAQRSLRQAQGRPSVACPELRRVRRAQLDFFAASRTTYRGKAQMKSLLIGLLLCSVAASAQAGSTTHSSPDSVDAGDYIYISTQGPRGVDGALPSTFAAQARQALSHLKSVVEASGLTMDHVVYTTVYLTDMNQYLEMNRVYAEFFGKVPPARAVLGVAALPDPPFEINAVG